MRRAGVVLSGIVVTLVVAACASTGHSWEDEFTARLEGASGSIEEAATTMRTETSGSGYPEVFIPLSQTLGHKAERRGLVRKPLFRLG